MDSTDFARQLYPAIRPDTSGRLDVGDGHQLHFETCGRADAPPVVVLHGGPGGGVSPALRRFFDPDRWRIVLFDQRGAGRSTPHASLTANTTWDLVADVERLRNHLGIDAWALFGGSWGSTLALAYAQTHPEHVLGLFLRGVFLGTQSEFDWFYGGGAGALLPEAWERFLAPLNDDERSAPIAAYHTRLTHDDPETRRPAALAWAAWESAALSRAPQRQNVGAARRGDPAAADALSRIECHYMINNCFFKRPDQLMDDLPRITHLPAYIVQGRIDLITPPRTAWRLARAWPSAHLSIVEGAGHAATEPGLVDGLVRATDDMATRLGRRG